jgi:hypothetical protein
MISRKNDDADKDASIQESVKITPLQCYKRLTMRKFGELD